MLPVPENFKRRLLAELSSQIPAQASAPPAGSADRARGRVRRRGASWLAGGLGLIAAGAAAAVVAASVTPAPARSGPSAHGRPSPAAHLSGRQILLTAATAALNTPVVSGTFWHVKTQGVAFGVPHVATGVTQYWTRRDGMQWESFKPGVITRGGRAPFTVAGAGLTFGELQKLPASPAALKAWVIDATQRSDPGLSASQLDLSALDDGLLVLLYQVPAPPAVRAAAFGAMASFPDVQSLGPAQGGQALVISVGGGEQERVIIDPATATVRGDIASATVKGEKVAKGVRVLAAGWTNHLP
jgi:hypothetical protein